MELDLKEFRKNFRREPLYYPGDELHKAKNEKLQKLLVHHDLDGVLFLRHDWVRYITDFYVKGYRRVPEYEYLTVVPRGKEPVLGFYQGTDTMRIHARALQDDIRRLPEHEKWSDVIVGIFKDYGLTQGRIAIDAFPYTIYERLKRGLPGVEFVEGLPLYNELTVIKHKLEIDLITQAQKLVNLGVEAALKSLREGIREYEIGAEAERAMLGNGSEMTVVLPNTITGENIMIYERMESGRKIHKGDVVWFDLTSVYRGYCGDTGYTTVFGRATQKQKEVYKTTLDALNAGIKAAKPGVKISEVAGKVTKVIRESSFREYERVGNIGHQMGYGWEHHPPMINEKVDEKLRPGMVLAMEPGIVIFDKKPPTGAHIEYVIQITETGNRHLTGFRHPDALD